MLTRTQVQKVVEYIDSDAFKPNIFSQTYNPSAFNNEDKELIGKLLFEKSKELRNIASDNLVVTAHVMAVAKQETHCWNFFKNRELSKDKKTILKYIEKQADASDSTLQLAIDFGHNDARLFKVEHNIFQHTPKKR